MKNVLILSDFSAQARAGIRFAAVEMAPLITSLTILNALFSGNSQRNTLIHLDDILRERSERGLAADLAFARDLNPDPALKIKVQSLPIRYDEAIREVLRQESVNLLLIPSLEAFSGGRLCDLKLDEQGLAQALQVPVMVLPSNFL